MIYYNLNTINGWNFGDDNIIKVYKHGAVCYYKITSGDTPTPVQEPCFAVVDDITQYSETEFEDVYGKATEKWYKLNNLNQYEKYGVYGSGRTICEGSTSRLPQGYTEVEYIENTSTSYIDTSFKPNQDTRIILTAQTVTSQASGKLIGSGGFNKTNAMQFCYEPSSTGSLVVSWGTVAGWTTYSSCIVDYNVHTYDWNKNEFYRDDTLVGSVTYANFQCTDNLGIFRHIQAGDSPSSAAYFKGKIFSLKIFDNGTLVRDFVPCKRDSDDKYGMYDIVNDVFYVSPNNIDFSGGEPITPTDCVTTYEGKLTVDGGYEYIYSGGSWVNVGEVSGSTASLPNVPFSVNYNAKNYDSSTKTLLKTSGQLVDVDAQITAGTPTVNDGYLTIASSTRATISGYQNYFNRDASNPNLTIISKQTTSGSYCHMFANRDSNYNWMYRCYNTELTLHGTREQGSIAVTTQPVIESVRIDSNRLATYNNYTNNTSSTKTGFQYGGTNSGKFAIFAGYGTSSGEWFVGDFYWVYMSQNTLTDEQVQQVITYNEGGGGEPIYPIEYTVKQDPPDNVSFTSMTEAESYECPWVGMQATIDGVKYIFSGDSQSGYEWVYNPSRLPIGYTEVEYVENTGTSYFNTNFTPNQDTRVVMQYQMVTDSGAGRFWGAGAWNSATGLEPNYEGGYLQISWLGKTSWTRYNNFLADYNKHTLDLNKNYLYLDETLVGSNTYTTRTASDPIGVFTYIGSGRPSSSYYWGQEHFKGKMYSFKVYDNGTLVRDFVPCIRDNDNTVGAYDIVNDVFYTVPTGYTTDKLIAGDPV